MTERDAGARRADEATVSALAEELDAARKLDPGLAEAKVRAVAARQRSGSMTALDSMMPATNHPPWPPRPKRWSSNRWISNSPRLDQS